MITVVVLNYNDATTTSKLVKSIVSYSVIDHVIVVDNHSTDNSLEELYSLSSNKVDVVRTDKNGGYGYGNNYGVKKAYYDYNSDIVLIANPDIEIGETTVIRMEEIMRTHEEISICAPIMKMPDGTVNGSCCWSIPTGWQYTLGSAALFNRLAHKSKYDDFEFIDGIMFVDAVAGSCLMIRVSDFMQCNGYDENLFLYCEENVLAIKMKKANKRTAVINDFFTHYHSVSISKTINSYLKRDKLMWDSRKYVLREYYGFGPFQMILVSIVSTTSTIIRWFLVSVGKING